MSVDYKQYAARLEIKPVHARIPENDTGYLTPRSLYEGYTPFTESIEEIHATVGRNTLPYFADKVDGRWNILEKAGSIRDGRMVLAHQLIPKDDYTIYDMVPRGFGCGHCNPGVWRGTGISAGLNLRARGYELENLQNGDNGDPFTESQYIKLALSIAYNSAVARVRNLNICSHWDTAMGAILAGKLLPKNAHRDPNWGPFDWGRFYGHLWEIRKPEHWPEFWQLPLWEGR